MYIVSFLLLCLISMSQVNGLKDHWKSILHAQDLNTLSLSLKSPQCSNDTRTWLESLKVLAEVSVECLFSKRCSSREKELLKDHFWALEQLDAFGKLPATGLFEIPLILDGSYQECQRISGKTYETNYCYLVLLPGKNASCTSGSGGGLPSGTVYFRSAVCMSDSCDAKDLAELFNGLPLMPFTACTAFCSRFPVPKTSAFWGFSTFMIVMLAVVIMASLFDYIREEVRKSKEGGPSDLKKNTLPVKILLAFSMWINSELLLSVKEQKPGFIKCLDCIRFLSILWVVTGHTFTFLLPPDAIRTPVSEFPNHFWNHLLLNAFVSVDTFFLLSGIVVAYLFFKTPPKPQQIRSPATWILFYVHRYLRLTPPYMIVIGFFIVYGNYVQGPFSASQFNTLVPGVKICENNWWRNLLYINNMVDSDKACYGPTWYLAVDTQLYLIAPVILIGFYYSAYIGAALIIAMCIVSIVAVYVLFAVYDLPADFIGNGNTGLLYDIIYHKPWVRCPPYLLGLLVGYGIAVYGARKVRLNLLLTILGWMASFGIMSACIFSTYDYDKGAYWSVFARATFYNFSRLGWAIAVSWVIVANHFGWGGPINAFMSHPIWQPLGRLSYCAYIVHFFTLFWFLNISDKSIHFYSTFQIFIYYAVPACLLSYIFAFFWSCMFEVPILKLEKMLIEWILTRRNTSENEERLIVN